MNTHPAEVTAAAAAATTATTATNSTTTPPPLSPPRARFGLLSASLSQGKEPCLLRAITNPMHKRANPPTNQQPLDSRQATGFEPVPIMMPSVITIAQFGAQVVPAHTITRHLMYTTQITTRHVDDAFVYAEHPSSRMIECGVLVTPNVPPVKIPNALEFPCTSDSKVIDFSCTTYKFLCVSKPAFS